MALRTVPMGVNGGGGWGGQHRRKQATYVQFNELLSYDPGYLRAKAEPKKAPPSLQQYSERHNRTNASLYLQNKNHAAAFYWHKTTYRHHHNQHRSCSTCSLSFAFNVFIFPCDTPGRGWCQPPEGEPCIPTIRYQRFTFLVLLPPPYNKFYVDAERFLSKVLHHVRI